MQAIDTVLCGPALGDGERQQVLTLQTRAHLEASDPEASLASATAALELARTLGHGRAEADLLRPQIHAFAELGLGRQALECGLRSLDLARGLGDHRIESGVLLSMSYLALDTGDEAETARLLDQSLAAAQAAGSADDEFWALNKQSTCRA